MNWYRSFKFLRQRITRGFDDSETWSLDHTIAKFVLPRLIRFKEVNNGMPGGLTEQQWNEILDKMIFSFKEIENEFYQCIPNDDRSPDYTEVEKLNQQVEEGLELFGKYFRNLWW